MPTPILGAYIGMCQQQCGLADNNACNNLRLRGCCMGWCAGAGLQATPHQGKRRSTRTSCKPLEWWRNEIKVYERKFRSAPFHAPLFP